MTAPVLNGVDPDDRNHEPDVTLSRALVARIKSALDVGQSIIDDKPWAEEQEALRAILVEKLNHTRARPVPVTLWTVDAAGQSRRVGQVDVLAVPEAEPQGLAWLVRSKLIYNVFGDEFTDDDVAEWEA